MKQIFTKVVVPSMLALSTLGIGAVVATVPASAASTTAKAPVTLTGTVTKAETAKSTFWLKVGTKTLRVIYSSSTKFKKGHGTSLVKGAVVTVTGTYAGKSTSVFKATSISA